MKVYQAVLAIIRFRPKLWTFNLISMLVLIIGWALPGLLTREFFNLLEGKVPTQWTLWPIVAGLAGCGVARAIGLIGLPLTNRPFGEIGRTLVQKNLLARILQMPGARSLPPDEAPGKAANRFKDDAFEMPLFGLWLNDLLGSLAQVIFAVSLMLYINARITVIVVLPMLVVLV